MFFTKQRIRHGITVNDELSDAEGYSLPEPVSATTSSDTQIFLVVEPLNIRLPPAILEFVVQLSARLKSFSKLMPLFRSELNAQWPLMTRFSPATPRVLEQQQQHPSKQTSLPAGKGTGLSDEDALPDLLNASAKLGQVALAVSFKVSLFFFCFFFL
jgi:hypothetical protein